MPVYRVLKSPGRSPTWRAEEYGPNLWRLLHHGGLVLDRASLDAVVTLVLDMGGDPTELAED